MAYCWWHRVGVVLQYVCALYLWLAALCAALFALPAMVRHFALCAIGMDAYATVALCRATGGTVPVPRYQMLWLLTAAVLGPLDVFVYGCGDSADEAMYWTAKLHVLLMLRFILSHEHHRQLQRAVAQSQLPHALLRHMRGVIEGDPSVMRMWRPGLIAVFLEGTVQPIQQFFIEHTQVLEQVMKTMHLLVHMETLPVTLFQTQWSSLRSLTVQRAAGSCTMHPSTMDALIRATPNLCQLTIMGYKADPQFAADWTLTDGWMKLHRFTMVTCDSVLWHCVILQTRQLTRVVFENIGPHVAYRQPLLLREFVRRNGGTLASFHTNCFGMDEVELLARCRKLQYIYLCCIGAPWDASAYTWRRLATLIQRIVTLRMAKLRVPPVPSDIQNMRRGCLRHITTLMLGSPQIPKQALNTILQAAPNVRILQLTRVQGAIDCATLHSIVTSVPQLRRLYLADIETMNDGVLCTIATALPQLTHLWLRYSSIMDEDSGDAGRWATVDSVPQRMLKHIKLISLDRTRDHTQAELASVERLRTALRALAGRTHRVLGTTAVAFDNHYLRMANNTCDFEWPPPARMQYILEWWPDLRDILW